MLRPIRSFAATVRTLPSSASTIDASCRGVGRARGDAAAKRNLSLKQARSVQSYLVSRGVARKRLSTRGYGGDKPIAPNLTARGREKNRRVEFKVLEAD